MEHDEYLSKEILLLIVLKYEDIATKLDKIKRSQIQKQLKMIRDVLSLLPETVMIPFSSETKQGRDELWELVENHYMENEKQL